VKTVINLRGYVNSGEFLDQLSEYRFFKKNYTLYSLPFRLHLRTVLLGVSESDS
jgi:hypothetical protein